MSPADAASDAPQHGAHAPRDFPIVGVGASAGGLAATTELLQHLGSHPGVGIVAVHHLSPAHESSLVEILARTTSLPVLLATDGAQIEQDHVYVVPPNAGLLLDGRRLRLTARREDAGLHLPIDRFFESLAENVQQLAIGVLLSGSGSDGSAGARAIKAAGGVTFVQDGSAEYQSMPESAVATGCVDGVLSPRAIAAEIVRRGAEPGWSVPLAGDAGLDDPTFRRLLLLLRKTSGIDFANYKPGTLRRRAERRIFLRRMHSLAEYLTLLEQDPDEAKVLCEEVLIHVTSFFRDASAFEALESVVFPELVRRRAPGAPIRIWVPGCSTGEEAYSIAISLLDFLARTNLADVPLKLFCTDVSAPAVERARLGRYPESVRSDITPERLQAYFTLQGSGYQINRAVRDICIFARHDATRDPPFSGMDLISCRNLMIYLGVALQARALSIFHYALKDSGFLILGSSETIHDFPGFSCIDPTNKIYQRTSAAPHPVFDFATPELSSEPGVRVPEILRAPGPLDVHREADRLVLTRFAPPGVVITDDMAIVQFRGNTAPYLAPAPGVPSFDLLRMVRSELRSPVRQAIDRARSKRSVVTTAGLRLLGDESAQVVEVVVMPMPMAIGQQRFFVVLFRDVTPPDEPGSVELAERGLESEPASSLDQVTDELTSTRHYLESVIERLEASNEELRAANEEVTSSNEELRSTNEELQMAKEEIQANNEELHSLNEEMAVRTTEATRLSDDLTNVLSSVELPIVLIGRDATVRRFAPAAARVLGLTAQSIGRPLADARRRLADTGAEMARDVLDLVRPAERTLQDEEGRWYQLTARPYLTRDRRIDGTVLVAFDVDPIKKATERLAAVQRERAAKALERSESEFRDVLGTTAAGIIMADAAARMVFVNPSITQLFGYSARELLGRPMTLLVAERQQKEHDEWLSTYVETLASHGVAGEREVTGRRKDGTELSLQITLTPLARESGLVIVCFVTDVTARRESEQRIVAYQEKLRRVSFDAALAEERERRRIAADLHDRIGQSLALAKMKLESMPRLGGERTAVDDAIDLLSQSIVDARTLIFDLSPPILYELGLEDALSWLAEDLRKRWGIAIAFESDQAPKPLDEAAASLVFRAVRELLTNVLKHARASAASVSLRRSGDDMEIEVEDQGVGFDLEAAQVRPGHGGFGLFSVREQISRLGGTVEVESAEKQGTRVTLRLPLKLE